jgi:hypothetical protein
VLAHRSIFGAGRDPISGTPEGLRPVKGEAYSYARMRALEPESGRLTSHSSLTNGQCFCEVVPVPGKKTMFNGGGRNYGTEPRGIIILLLDAILGLMDWIPMDSKAASSLGACQAGHWGEGRIEPSGEDS